MPESIGGLGGTPLSQVQRVIDAPAALRAVTAAVQAAAALGVHVNVAVVDAAGVLAAFARMPGAPLHSVDIAIDKAYTATSFGLPTSRWNEVLQQHSQAVREGLVRRPRFVAFGGGLPMVEGDVRIGAIGVSGASEQQDEAIACAGLQALGLLPAAA
ncbi:MULTISPECIES: GlcG/HbpS family heme-binding protein [Acidovorax]|uniref:Cobalamin adenosyltransferase n=1 Tax=Acidovorax carolinensis TaxID=553814 RepID=A0A240TXM7_9BURK|nr:MULTISPECIES: heme-binding protein [Acidovorax]ART49924.1 cobalamin adenosyltransferase [Acidovorax carolinensis]ART56974.1 cobalamin adenosyltransferase [Acidovorax carolinensis]ART60655.1 cobalamin adenosyltransferase [Acidovorax carolinensis]MBP3979535.1 heme-binding protein [Acidovorax sp. JG5]